MPLLETFGNAASRGYRTSGSKPAAPVLGTVTVGSSTSVSIPFTVNSYGLPLTAVNVVSSPSVSLGYSGTTSPLTVTGTFVQGTAYTFTMTASNAVGTSAASSASNSVTPNPLPVVTGGTLTSDATYYYRTFTGNGTLAVSNAAITADVLIVAGGGAGAGSGNYSDGGGGGAGGLVGLSSQSLNGSLSVVIGAGGTSAAGVSSTNGGNSSVTGLTAAIGGGYGARSITAAAYVGGTGGSGGGCSSCNAMAARSGFTSGQGTYGGGQGFVLNNYTGGGGGGGASVAGGDVGSNVPGDAGAGGNGTNAYSSWATVTGTGVSGYYAGGGGGGGHNNGFSAGAGGLGGGGRGYNGNNGTVGLAGTANTGGGGGGGTGAYGGNVIGYYGGSGIVIVRYTRAQVGG